MKPGVEALITLEALSHALEVERTEEDEDALLLHDDFAMSILNRLRSEEAILRDELEVWALLCEEDMDQYFFWLQRGIQWQVLYPKILKRLASLRAAH